MSLLKLITISTCCSIKKAHLSMHWFRFACASHCKAI